MEPSGLCSADAESVGPAGGVEVGIVAGAEAVTASRGSLSDENILANFIVRILPGWQSGN